MHHRKDFLRDFSLSDSVILRIGLRYASEYLLFDMRLYAPEESFQIRSGVESLKLDAVRSTSRVARLVAKKRRKSVSVAASEAAQR